MSPLVTLALSYGAALAVFAAAYGAMLAFHSPARPRWMNGGWADNTVVVGLVTAAIFAFAWMLNALLALELDPLLALTLVLAASIFGAWTLWRVMHIAERLDAARRGAACRRSRISGISAAGAPASATAATAPA